MAFQAQHLTDYFKKNRQRYQAWRHDLHAHPEIAFEEERTADFVARTLQSFGLEVHTGLAKTGVVGVLTVGMNGSHQSISTTDPSIPRIGIRADLDALPIVEASTHLEYCSQNHGTMHACGHDGHVVILLAAADYLSQHKSFWDSYATTQMIFIFQPAEENVAGGKVMVDEGLFERFAVDEVFALHNIPGLPQGSLHTRIGAQMASADFFHVTLSGKGGHAAWPHHCDDLIVYASQCIQQWQTIVSRTTDPLATAVVSVTQIHAGESLNALPAQLTLAGTVRCLDEAVRQATEEKMHVILQALCQANEIGYTWSYDARYPVTWNHKAPTHRAVEAARSCPLITTVNEESTPLMGAEDFAWMLRSKPGAYVLLGAGDGPMLHHNQYNFNDELISIGASYWVSLCDHFIKVRCIST